MLHGVINVYKEAGYTSHDVVAKLRGIAGQRRIGHTGTLDPDATGVLPVCLGSATRLCDMLTDETKEYVAELAFGIMTDTQDLSGQVLCRRRPAFTDRQARDVIASFLGVTEQIPPMYSARRVGGKRLYELAREGKMVERRPSPITIHEIEILSLEPEGTQPGARIRVVCSKGVYIRTLCHDIGERLGCGAAMRSLIRTRVGRFTLEGARTLSQLQQEKDAGRLADALTRIDTLFDGLPAAQVREEGRRLLENGNPLPASLLQTAPDAPDGRVRVYDSRGRFYGIYGRQENGKRFPVRMFLERDE